MNRRVEPGPAVWVDERLSVSESPIEGSGLFFTEDVPRGTVVIRLGGRLVSSAELDRLIREAVALSTSAYVDTIAVYEDAHLVLPSATQVHFCNHSCDPNLWLVGPYELATRRPATAGDEATTDYGTFSGAEGFAMDCRCGMVDCRSVILSTDWQRADVQAQYEGHWSPAVQARIGA